MTNNSNVIHINNNLHAMTPLYNETTELLHMAHDYFAYHGKKEQNELDEKSHLLFSSEMTRITVRLSSVMAWLLARKAVLHGEISMEEATSDTYRLGNQDVCLIDVEEARSVLPPFMVMLLDRSLAIYKRIDRLDNVQNQHSQSFAMPIE